MKKDNPVQTLLKNAGAGRTVRTQTIGAIGLTIPASQKVVADRAIRQSVRRC